MHDTDGQASTIDKHEELLHGARSPPLPIHHRGAGMTWHIPLLLNVVIVYVLHPISVKMNADMGGRAQRLIRIFSVNAAVAWILTSVFPGTLVWDYRIALILGLGVLNSLANYAHWRAMEVNMTRTSMLAQGDDVIAMILAYVFLGETKILTPSTAVGVTLCMGCAIAVGVLHQKKTEIGSKKKVTKRTYLGWVAVYCTIWGLAVYSFRALGTGNIPILQFAATWYTGSIVGAIVLARLTRHEGPSKRGIRSNLLILAFSATSLTGLGFAIWAKSLAPITVVQPILQVAESILPAILGLVVFKEARQFGWIERLILALGVAGSVVLGLSSI